MSLNYATIRTLFRTEMRMVLRDKRMLATSILLPLLVTPLMFFASSWGVKRHERKLAEMTYSFAVKGTNTAALKRIVTAACERLEAASKTNKAAFKLKEVSCADPATALDKAEIQFFLELASTNATEGLKSSEAGKTNRKTSAADDSADDSEVSADGRVPAVRIVFRGDRHESSSGMSKMRETLEETRRVERAQLLKRQGFPVRPLQVATVVHHDVASQSQVAGLTLGRFLTVLLLLFILSSGAVVATDSLAGEKERGTLETLLITSAGRLEILAAKHLVIVAVALLITCIQILNLLVYIRFKLIPVPLDLAAAISPATGLLLLVLYLPLAALAANILLMVSGYARSYKEAQMWFMPVLLVGLAPALAPCMPGIPLRSIVVLVPVANIALAAREILIGSFDWPMIGVAWMVTAFSAVWVGRAGVRSLNQEKLITAAERDQVEFLGGPRLFERRVLRWFAVLWGLLLLVSNYTQNLDIRLQLVINLAGLFLGACCLMIWVYRLDWRTALAWRPPRPAVWLGVAAAIPGGFITALACYKLGNYLLPTPSRIAESFTEAVIPAGIPFLELVLILSILPGIFEEITFRGLLLHGLRRRLSPVLLAVVVGLVFGIFHVALFRFVPTAVLGMFFAGVAILTGSIFPSMLWHACNNALGLLVAKANFPENELDLQCYAGGIGLLLVAFWIFWRNRTPYPELRSKTLKRQL